MENMILQPIVVGGQTFKNRIMFPPLTTGYEKNGMISEQDMGFYTRLAKGGVGYIVLGDVAPINSFSPTPKLFDDSQIPAFKELADSVHAYGTKLGVQLFHPEYDVDAINSLFMQKKFDEMRQRLHHDMMFFTDEASEEMLMSIIDKMCACAVRAQKAGVDVIQIHGDRLNGCLWLWLLLLCADVRRLGRRGIRLLLASAATDRRQEKRRRCDGNDFLTH